MFSLQEGYPHFITFCNQPNISQLAGLTETVSQHLGFANYTFMFIVVSQRKHAFLLFS